MLDKVNYFSIYF